MSQTCTVGDCTRPVFNKTLVICQLHYRRKYKGQDMNMPIRVQNPDQGCSVDGCDRKHLAKGLCNTHYQRMKTGASLDMPIRLKGVRTECVISGCERPFRSNGMCKTHNSTSWTYSVSSLQMQVLYDRGCQICGSTENLRVDHDHSCCPGDSSCGECIRGCLCSGCNMALGAFQDSAPVLQRAIAYLSANGVE